MSLRLVAMYEGPDILVDRDMILVGRHPACDVRLDSLMVSSRHCCITPTRGGVQVKDLGSTNGIWINGRRVGSGWIRPGDEFSIAYHPYKLEDCPRPALIPAHASGQD
jgi:pSer/pThr/pTyr-binding forkhead associated (FHA) protein